MKTLPITLFVLLLNSFSALCQSATKSSEKKILSFQEGPQNVPIDEANKKIVWAVPGFVDLTKIKPTIKVSDGAKVSPASDMAQDFTKPVIYTVTASDGSTATYTAVASKREGTASGRMPNGGSAGMPSGETRLKPDFADVPYANQSAAQKLDIYLPKNGKTPYPVIVQIHGGAFKMGDKADGQVNASLEGLKQGYAVVSINYRMSGEAKFPAAVYDCKAAVRFVKANAKTYNFDPNKIAAWGGSAGGHLVAMLGTSGGVKELEDLSQGNAAFSSNVQAVVDWFGPINFNTMDGHFRASGKGKPDHDAANSPESEYIGKKITDAPDLVKKANPTSYISRDDAVFFIQHGTADPLVPTQQSIEFAQELEKTLGKSKVTYIPLEGAGHGGPQFNTPENLKLVFAFLDKVLK
jgi:acetyl esterase/lipase